MLRPKVDFEHGLVRPGFHQDLGGTSRFLQVDLAYGLTGHTTLLASAPILTDRSYDIGHPPVLTENYKTSGIGDTLVSVRHALIASPSFSLVAGAGLEMPTGDYRLVAPAALFDIGVLDPMLQPGSGSWDVAAERPGLAPRLEGRARPHGSALLPDEHHEPARVQLRGRRDREPRPGRADRLEGARLDGAQEGAPGPQRRTGTRTSPRPAARSSTRSPASSRPFPASMSVYLFLPVPVYRYVNESQVAPRLSLVVGIARIF